MDDDYPRLRVDRDVAVIRDGRPEQARLRGWLDGHQGPLQNYRIELVARAGNYASLYTATGPNMFEALVRLRRQLEPDGLTVAVQGSRRDTLPRRHGPGRGRRDAGLRHAPRTACQTGQTWPRCLTTRHPPRSRRSMNNERSPTHGWQSQGRNNQMPRRVLWRGRPPPCLPMKGPHPGERDHRREAQCAHSGPAPARTLHGSWADGYRAEAAAG